MAHNRQRSLSPPNQAHGEDNDDQETPPLKKIKHQLLRNANGRFAKHNKARIIESTKASSNPKVPKTQDAGGDRTDILEHVVHQTQPIEDLNQNHVATQIRSAFGEMLGVLVATPAEIASQTPGFLDPPDAFEQTYTNEEAVEREGIVVRLHGHFRKAYAYTVPNRHIGDRSSNTTESIICAEDRANQNRRTTSIVDWLQHTRTYNQTDRVVHPFNLPPPQRIGPVTLDQHKFVRSSSMVSHLPPSAFGHVDGPGTVLPPWLDINEEADPMALYEKHPAYAHLTTEQKVEVQAGVEEKSGKTVLERKFDVVQAELRLNVSRSSGEEEDVRERKEIVECLEEEWRYSIDQDGQNEG